MAHPTGFPRHILWAASCELLWSQHCSSKRKESSWKKEREKKRKRSNTKNPTHSLCFCLGTCLLLCLHYFCHNGPKYQSGPVALFHCLNTQDRSLPPLLKGNCRFLSTRGSQKSWHPAACLYYHSQPESSSPRCHATAACLSCLTHTGSGLLVVYY